jgi:hypothetical protein
MLGNDLTVYQFGEGLITDLRNDLGEEFSFFRVA